MRPEGLQEKELLMPNYDYCCSSCGHKEEILQKMTDAPLTECPQCKKETFKRLFGTGIGLQFHGSGFYSTDYGSSQSSPPPLIKRYTSAFSSRMRLRQNFLFFLRNFREAWSAATSRSTPKRLLLKFVGLRNRSICRTSGLGWLRWLFPGDRN